jgi:hypothetical protein
MQVRAGMFLDTESEAGGIGQSGLYRSAEGQLPRAIQRGACPHQGRECG